MSHATRNTGPQATVTPLTGQSPSCATGNTGTAGNDTAASRPDTGTSARATGPKTYGPRANKPRPPGTLKAHIDTLRQTLGTVADVAELLRGQGRHISATQVHRWTDEREDGDPTIRDVMLLERLAGAPVVTAFVAQQIPGTVVLYLPVDDPGASLLDRDVAAVGQDTARVVEDYLAFVQARRAGRRIEARAGGQLIDDIDREIGHLGAMRAHLLETLAEDGVDLENPDGDVGAGR